MPLNINGATYYQTAEAANEIGISISTLRRWIRKGKVKGASKKDFRGWYLYSQDDIQRIKNFFQTTTDT